MGKPHKFNLGPKNQDIIEHTIWFHLYKNASLAKLPYDVRGQGSGYPTRGYEGNFWVLVMLIIIIIIA